MPEAVISYGDGALIASVALNPRAWLDAFRDRGRRVAFEGVRRRISTGRDQRLTPLFPGEDKLGGVGKMPPVRTGAAP